MTPITEAVPTLTVYGGVVPNKATQTVDEFANAVHPYMNFFNTDSIPEVQAFRTSLNTLATQMNTLADEVNTASQSASDSATQASAYATLAINSANFKGDWVANFETVGYALGYIVTYTDGHKYQSKVSNNLVEPTTLTNTTEWDFIEAVSPSELALKAPLASPTFTGTVTLPSSILNGNLDFNGKVANDITYGHTAIPASDIDCSNSRSFSKTISAITTFTISNVPTTGKSCVIKIDLINAGAFTTSFPASVKWVGGNVPAWSVSGKDKVVLETNDGGTTWDGIAMIGYA